GWGVMGRNPRPGEIRQVAYQQLARGADSQILFCWRTPTAGREQYWHGLLGHDGTPGRRYEEAAATVRELRQLAPEIEGTGIRAPAALVYDYESAWAFEIQPSYAPGEAGELAGASNYKDATRRFYGALFRAGVSVDMVRPGDDLTGYKLVFAPHLFILGDDTALRLVDYVRGGGVLVADCRTGVKDETGLCHARILPGLLGDALGISIHEYEALGAGVTYSLACAPPLAGSHRGARFADWVNLRGAERLAGYDEWHLRPYAAVTRNRFGRGWGYYVGTIVEEESFYDELATEVLGRAGIVPAVRPPLGVEAIVREGGGRRVLFLINHTEADTEVETPEGKVNLLSGSVTGRTAVIEPYGVMVLKLEGTTPRVLS
ncbi:MAG TPA: beta-galactosidase trimerization domain-containing protein, partial [Spirochaetia bacterium]|nr:beta-galactosidase trimerization domain-containing protein [Spirochaetia bacterium]